MHDLIDRQAAIDALDKHLQTTDVPVSYPGIISALTEWLNELPSAQPEPHWIPVTERLPKEEKGHYWICTDTGYQCQCRWTNDVYGLGASDRWEWKIIDIPQYQKVIAWMPLPEPYREGAQE